MGEGRRKRVWLAVLLALVVSGLGHAYIRRWARAFGWYLVITATIVLVVPDRAVEQLLARDAPPLLEIAPALIMAIASVIDVYVLTVRHNRDIDRVRDSHLSAADGSNEAGGDRSVHTEADGDPEIACPNCGRQLDTELDFCHWCTEPLSGAEPDS